MPNSLQLLPASDHPIPYLADLMTRSFEGYIVPVHITDAILHTMIRRDGIDLTASRILTNGDEHIGVAFIARRGWTCRLAAFGITSNARSSGVGTSALTSFDPSLVQAMASDPRFPLPPARMAYTGFFFGAHARMMPSPYTGEGTSRQNCSLWPGFHVPQRQSSLPVFGS